MSGRCVTWAFEQQTGAYASKLVLVKLADNSNDDGVSWPSVGYMVRHTELSERAIREHLRKLEDAGLIRIIPRKNDDGSNRSNVYQLCMGGRGQVAPTDTNPAPPGAAGAKKPERGAGGVGRTVQAEPSSMNRQRTLTEATAAEAAAKRLVSRPKVLIGDYTPSESAKAKAVAYWARHKRPDLNIEDEVFKFTGFHTGKGSRMVDWEAAFQTWYCNALQMNRAPFGGGPGAGGATVIQMEDRAASVNDWIERLRIYYGYVSEDKEYPLPKGTWQKKWGPAPHEKGCRVPPEAHAKIKPKVA